MPAAVRWRSSRSRPAPATPIPVPGTLRLNAATQSAATQIYVDLLDADGIDVSGLLDALADSGSAVKGWLTLRHSNDRTRWLAFRLTAVTSAAGYRKLAVAALSYSAASPFADGDALVLSFTRTGDKGDAGSLAGGTLTGNLDADGTHKVINLPAPTSDGDATRKSFVDALGNQARVWAAVWGA